MEEAAEVTVEVVETDASPVVKYSIADAAIATLKDKYNGLTADTPAKYKEVTAGIAEFRTMRATLEKERKRQKSSALEFGRLVDSEAKRLTIPIREGEDKLKAAKAEVDDEKARVKREKEEAEEKRVQGIMGKIAEIRKLREMLLFSDNDAATLRKQLDKAMFIVITVDEFGEFEAEAEAVLKGIIEEIDRVYKSRIIYEEEQKEHEAEKERLAKQKEEQDKKEADFAAEQEEFEEKKRKAADEEQAKKDAEQKVKDDAAMKEQQEQESKDKAERESKEKKAREERAEAAKPDNHKLKTWLASISDEVSAQPCFDTGEAIEFSRLIQEDIEHVIGNSLKAIDGGL